jgi:hypothetical protein
LMNNVEDITKAGAGSVHKHYHALLYDCMYI